ncbi:large terminase [Desulfocucumis palustris]|uniref:Large terminase n=2 Tax=Desulfocucumis palustris TaxID=1898651 RepID=A0A2L2XDN3_9FIRM|nr:large terminase [Desulfocucumis palustris]
MELAQDRILASKLGWQRYFSAPLFEEDGIDELYRESDMRKWLVICKGCRRESIVEEEFPDNVRDERKKKGKIYLACPKCEKPLDVDNAGWVPEHPERTQRGYRAPQLIIKNTRLDLIWDRWLKVQGKPAKLARFRRSVLGIADSGNMQPITGKVLELVEASSNYHFQDRSDEVCAMGIDMGDRAHAAVVAPLGEEGFRIIAAFHVDVEDLLNLIPVWEEAYNLGALIIDAMPYKTESKRVVRALKEAVGFIQYFKSTYKETTEGEDEKEVRVIHVDRDESLDDTTSLFSINPPQALLFKPRNTDEEKALDEVKRHLKKLVKEETAGPDGQKKISYKKNVENHYGMAINSARIALVFRKIRYAGRGLTGITVVGRNAVADINW